MHVDGVLDQLKRASGRRPPAWDPIVNALGDLEERSACAEDGRPWARIVAETVGCTVNQLRQAQHTLSVLRRLTDRDKSSPITLNRPFSHLEVLARIASIAPDRALELLRQTGENTYRDLRSAYDALKGERPEALSPLKLGHRNARALSDRVAAVLQNGVPFVPDRMRYLRWPEGFAYARPRFLGVGERGGATEFHGFSICPDSAPRAEDGVTRFIVRAATESTFFEVFHVFLSPLGPSTLVDAITLLRIANMAIYRLPQKGTEVKVYLEPKGNPVPDRRKLLIEDKYFRRRLARFLR